MPDNDNLRSFGALIQRLINRENLTRQECRASFAQILANEQPDLQQGAFIAALVAKGETAEEIAGAWQAIQEGDTNRVASPLPAILLENSGTGMDCLKTFNVSSAAALVCAAAGVPVARHGARALSSVCGTVDILEALGIDAEADVERVAASIREAGIGLFNGMSAAIHPKALGRILSQIRFGTTLNIAASLASPVRPTHVVRGVYSTCLVQIVAKVLREIGCQRGIVVCGSADVRENLGMDEFSTLGSSLFIEFDQNGLSAMRSVRPEDFGFSIPKHSEIMPLGNLEAETERFAEILQGRGSQACADIVNLNAGAGLYVAGKAENLKAGVAMAQKILASGQAWQCLEKWRIHQGRATVK